MAAVKKAPIAIIPVERVAAHIYAVRGLSVMLDSDLAALYRVLTKNLNLAVRRNPKRFPKDFMFRLTEKETSALRLQFATSNTKRGGRRYLPYVFTEQGVAMLSSVLKSDRAAEVNVAIMRTFVKMRRILAANEELARKVAVHDHQISILFEHVQSMLVPVPGKRKPIGFATVAD
ncbi:MAG: ORF6N domain-containing protein [Acidobacteriota bacterium]